MGVPKLTSFIDRNFTRWKREKVTGHLVIDGFSLCYYLYSFDWSHGGQYPQFHDSIVEYFKNLSASKIEAIVVYDGIDYKQEKVKTTLKRRKEMIQTINDRIAVLKSRQVDVVSNTLPLLAIEEFQFTLQNLLVKQVVVDGEADTSIAQLANYYNCPVLSKDSDFYVYALTGGFIHMDRFHWNSKPITADVYHVDAFSDQFNFRHTSVRLIIPAIAGNDFLPTIPSQKLTNAGTAMEYHKHCPFLSIVRYASQFDCFDDFILKLSSVDHFSDKDILQQNCLKCKKMYDSDVVYSLDAIISNTELSVCNGSIPRWIISQFRSCNLKHFIMEALILHKFILRIAVDDFHQQSSFLVSRPIRQALYCIINVETVTEYVRLRLELVGERVPHLIYAGGKGLPTLDQIQYLPLSKKSMILYQVLRCNIKEIEKLDSKWRLATASVVFWMLQTEVPSYVVKALLLCFMFCYYRNDCNFLREYQCNIPCKCHQWMSLVHFFAQWQSTYLDAVSLNQLLQLPLESRSPAELYDGKCSIYLASLHHTIASAESKLSVSQQKVHQLLLDVVYFHQEYRVVSAPKKVATQGKCLPSTRKSASVRTLFEHPNPFSILSVDNSEDMSTKEPH